MRCDGEARKGWGPFELFDELCKTPFRPRKRKQGHEVKLEDGGLLGFGAFKDLQVSFEEGAKAEVSLNIQDLWVVPKKAARDTNIEDAYGVGLEDEGEDSEDQLGEVVSSSSSDLQTQLVPSPPSPPMTQAQSSNSSDPAPQSCSSLMSMRWCCEQLRGGDCMSGMLLSSRPFVGGMIWP